ncbi:recombinase RecA [Candidatus Dependentiae bacterium]|nr:recombinase RecA [Candidatus Dependentiae bacterium]
MAKTKNEQESKPAVESNKEKLKVLDSAISGIEKKYGKGSIMKLGDSEHVKLPVIPTGILTLDVATGIGGVPRGRIIEIYGPESSGKTTLTLSIIAEAQKMGGIAAFIDAEHAFDPAYAELLGVNTSDLYISQPDDGEQALEIAEQLVRSGALDVIVVDSVAALTPRAEIEGEMGDSHMGLQARLMSQALRKLTGVISKSNTTMIFINQVRMKIGVMYGNPETTTGGNALKFYASMRMEIRKAETLKKGDDMIGIKSRVKIVKNKMASPFKSAEFDLLYSEGISKIGCIVDSAIDLKIINKSGAWFSYNDTKLGQGKDMAKQTLAENPDLLEEIKDKIYKNFNLTAGDDSEE